MSIDHVQYFEIVNWERFQHYKRRSPPWIKLYSKLLADYDIGCLQDASKAHLFLIWLLASQHNNCLPYDPEWIKGKIQAKSDVRLDIYMEGPNPFIRILDPEDASKRLAECKHGASAPSVLCISDVNGQRNRGSENRGDASKALIKSGIDWGFLKVDADTQKFMTKNYPWDVLEECYRRTREAQVDFGDIRNPGAYFRDQVRKACPGREGS